MMLLVTIKPLLSRWQSNAPDQIVKAWVGVEIVEKRIYFEPHYPRLVVLKTLFEPYKGLVLVTKSGIDKSNTVRGVT
jgi:hypothetical protein